MVKKVIVFIDANNWYHNLKYLFKPSSIDIVKLVNDIGKKDNSEIVEIRWYASMPNRKDNEELYKKQRAFLGHLEKQGVKIISRKLQVLSSKGLINERKNTIESWSLCENCKPIIESSFLDIPNQKKEKGIDVWIAIDMVKEAMREGVDGCILISGDADFIPAFSLIKEIGKDVLSASVSKGYSNELRQKFPYLILKKDDLNKCFKDYEK